MDGKRPIDRVRETERRNQPKFDRSKERVAQDEARLTQQARTHDDAIEDRALEAGESPDAAGDKNKERHDRPKRWTRRHR